MWQDSEKTLLAVMLMKRNFMNPLPSKFTSLFIVCYHNKYPVTYI